MHLKDKAWEWICKNPIKTIIISSFVIIFSLQSLYWILCAMEISCFSSPIDESDLLGFFGDIFGGLIGGVIALYILKKTLSFEKINARKEHQLQVMPFLNYKINNQKIIETEECIDIFMVKRGTPVKCLKFQIDIENCGVGNALYVRFANWEVVEKNGRINSVLLENDDMECITINSKKEKVFCISLPTYENYDEEIGQIETIHRKVFYKDILGNSYEDNIELEFYRLKYWKGEEQYEDEKLRIVKIIRKVQDEFDRENKAEKV